jgi:hypothetical protein
VRLALLDGIACDGAVGAKKVRFLLHLSVPHVLVQLADAHEHAHLGNGLKLRGARLPHVSGERRHGQELLRIAAAM